MMLVVTQKRSLIGSKPGQRLAVKGLGLSGIGTQRVLANTPAIRGMVRRVLHLVDVLEVEGEVTDGQ